MMKKGAKTTEKPKLQALEFKDDRQQGSDSWGALIPADNDNGIKLKLKPTSSAKLDEWFSDGKLNISDNKPKRSAEVANLSNSSKNNGCTDSSKFNGVNMDVEVLCSKPKRVSRSVTRRKSQQPLEAAVPGPATKRRRSKHGSAYFSKTRRERLYYVDKIIDKRVEADGRTTYLIKWKRYSSNANTWEPTENLPTHMVEEFDKALADTSMDTSIPKIAGENKDKPKILASRDPSPNITPTKTTATSSELKHWPPAEFGKERGITMLEPQPAYDENGNLVFNTERNIDGKQLREICGWLEFEGQRFFVVNFQDRSRNWMNLIRPEDMNRAFPQEVIRFYSSKITWRK